MYFKWTGILYIGDCAFVYLFQFGLWNLKRPIVLFVSVYVLVVNVRSLWCFGVKYDVIHQVNK